jgi:hypothetical protein
LKSFRVLRDISASLSCTNHVSCCLFAQPTFVAPWLLFLSSIKLTSNSWATRKYRSSFNFPNLQNKIGKRGSSTDFPFSFSPRTLNLNVKAVLSCMLETQTCATHIKALRDRCRRRRVEQRMCRYLRGTNYRCAHTTSKISLTQISFMCHFSISPLDKGGELSRRRQKAPKKND